jgi:acylphosphatase
MKLKVMIHGPRVHEVGYRSFLLNEADLLGLKGFSARNLREGDRQIVQILADGEENRISQFRDFIKNRRPKTAEVSGVSFENWEENVESITKFSFRFSTLQINKGIESILRIEKLQETMIGKQDQMLGKMDQMLGKQDQMLGKQDQMLDKQDQMLGKQDQMLGKQDQMLGKQDQMLEKQDKTIDKLEDVRQDIVVEIRSSSDAIVSEIGDSRESICVEHRNSHAELKNYLDERLGKMDEEISRVKARIGM